MAKCGIIFDLDGVIVDTAKYHYLAWRKLANSIGIDFSETQNEQLKGVSRVKSLETILEWGGKFLDEATFSDLMQRKNDDYLSYISTMNADEILDGVEDVLHYLKSKHIPMALGSASKNAVPILKQVGLYEMFDAIVDGNDVTKAKPDPEVFLKAADRIGVAPNEAVVFEDSLAGIEAANRVNMISIGIGSADVLTDADYVFQNFLQIDRSFIDRLINQNL